MFFLSIKKDMILVYKFEVWLHRNAIENVREILKSEDSGWLMVNIK